MPQPNLIDLTKPLDDTLEIYADDQYSDPPFVVEDWCSVGETGFRVSRLALGTQTGTHIDAPAHFVEDGATLEALEPAALIGPYLAIRPADYADDAAARAAADRHRDEGILFLMTDAPTVSISMTVLETLLALPCPVWIASGEVDIPGTPDLYYHRLLAERDVYLVEDLDREAMADVPDVGEVLALPLRLIGVSGAPCRVLIRPAR